MLARIFGSQLDIALLLLRISFGLIFAIIGWFHVSDVGGFTNAFANRFNIPLAEFSAPLVAWVEFLGGIGALLGIFTRYSGLLLAITMLVSTVAVRLPEGLQEGRDFLGLIGHWDIDLLLFAVGVALMVLGPGRYSVERLVLKQEI